MFELPLAVLLDPAAPQRRRRAVARALARVLGLAASRALHLGRDGGDPGAARAAAARRGVSRCAGRSWRCSWPRSSPSWSGAGSRRGGGPSLPLLAATLRGAAGVRRRSGWFGVARRDRTAGERYVPAKLVDGQVVPGHARAAMTEAPALRIAPPLPGRSGAAAGAGGAAARRGWWAARCATRSPGRRSPTSIWRPRAARAGDARAERRRAARGADRDRPRHRHRGERPAGASRSPRCAAIVETDGRHARGRLHRRLARRTRRGAISRSTRCR